MDNLSDLDYRIQSVQARLLRLQQAAVNAEQHPLVVEAAAELSGCLEELQAVAQTLRQQTADLPPAGRELGKAPLAETAANPWVRPALLGHRVWLTLELTGMGWWDWDVVSDQLTWSDRLFQLLGYSPGEVIPSVSAWRDRIHPDDRDWTSQALWRDLKNHSLGEVEYRVVHPDGSLHWLLVRGQGIDDADGQPQSMVGIVMDISDRKRLEAEQQAIQATLSASEERYRLLTEISPVGIFRFDPSGNCTYVNSTTLQIVGQPLEACLGPNWSDTIHPDDRDRMRERLQDYRAQSVTQPDVICRIECRHLRPNQALVWGLVQVVVERDSMGQVTGYIGTLTDISHRKRIEAVLSESEQRFRNMADHAPTMVWVTNAMGYCTFLSQSWYRLTGQTEATGLGLGWLEAVHPEDRELSETTFLAASQRQVPFRLDYRLRGADGEYRWMIDAASPWFGTDGEFKGYIGSVLDISDRKRIEAALQTSEEQRRLALDLTDTSTWDWDLVTGEVVWSENMFTLLGLTPNLEPLTYQFWRSCVHPEDIERLETAAAFHLQTQTLYCEEYRAVYPDGTIHWLLSKGRGVYDATGQAVRMVGITLDITERKQLELALQTSEEQLRLALDLNHIGSWDWQPNSGTASWNEYNYRLFGYQPGEVEPSYDRWIARIHPEDVGIVEQQVSHALATQANFAAEYRVLLPDGQIRWLLGKGRGIYGPTGRLLRMIGVAYDITERRQLEAERQQATRNLVFLAEITQDLANSQNMETILPTICAKIGEFFRLSRCHVDQINSAADQEWVMSDWSWSGSQADSQTDSHADSQADSQLDSQTGSQTDSSQQLYRFSDFLVEEFQQAASAGELIVIQDSLTDPRLDQAAFAELDARSFVVIPIVQAGQWQFLLSAVDSTPRHWHDDEIELLNELAVRIWVRLERALAETALRQREAFISSILTSITDTVLVFDSEWRYSFVNDQFLRMTGLQLAEVIGQQVWDLFPDQVRNELEHLLHQAMTERISVEFGFYYEKVERWLSGRAYPIPDGGLIIYSRDITEHKRRQTNAAFLAELMMDFATLSTASEIMQVASAKIGTYLNLSRCLFVEITAADIANTDIANADIANTGTVNTGIANIDIANADIANTGIANVFYDWAADGLPSLVGTYQVADFHSAAERQQLAAGLALVIPDTAAIPLGASAEEFRLLQIGAIVKVPYITQERWKFSLCAIQSEPRHWRRDEVELMQDLSARIWLRLERAYAEAALRLSEERRRMALDLTGINSWDWDLSTNTVSGSDNMLPLLGLRPNAAPFSYADWQSCMHPDDLDRIESSVALHLQNKTLYGEEYRVIYPDGSIHWLLSKARGIYDATGEAVRMVGITIDITERKQLELALQASEAKLSRILDSAIAVIVSFRVWDNRDWEYEYWSAGCETLYGFSVEELQSDKTLWLSQVFPHDREAVLMPLFESFFAEEHITVEYRFRCKDGSVRWICSVYASEQVEPGCWMVTSVNYDVTERKTLQQELLQINAALEDRVKERTQELEQALLAAEAANLSKNVFLSTMSHELRTPLNAILGFSELLGHDQTLTPDQQEQVEIINRSGDQLLDLINDILQMAKLEAGQTSLTLGCLNLRQLLQQVEDRFRPSAEVKGLQFTIYCDPSTPQSVEADEPKLRQVLANLLSNAVKFTQTGQVSLRLRVQPEQPPPLSLSSPTPPALILHFSVQDSGPGIDPLEQDLIFQPFVRTKTGLSSHQGTGLGLPISREFVRLMGGELTFSSSLGEGTTFSFQIPVAPILSEPSPTMEPSEPAQTSSRSLLTALTTMPPEWIDQLQQASRLLDEELIFRLLEQIPPTETLLLTTLTHWLEQFRFDLLIDLTVAAGSTEPTDADL